MKRARRNVRGRWWREEVTQIIARPTPENVLDLVGELLNIKKLGESEERGEGGFVVACGCEVRGVGQREWGIGFPVDLLVAILEQDLGLEQQVPGREGNSRCVPKLCQGQIIL